MGMLIFQILIFKIRFYRKCVVWWILFCHFWILHKISFSYMCMMYILWLICGWEKQKSKNKLWLITLEFDKIWKIWIHYKKDHLIRLLSVKKKLKKFILVAVIRKAWLFILNFQMRISTSICVGGTSIFELLG